MNLMKKFRGYVEEVTKEVYDMNKMLGGHKAKKQRKKQESTDAKVIESSVNDALELAFSKN